MINTKLIIVMIVWATTGFLLGFHYFRHYFFNTN